MYFDDFTHRIKKDEFPRLILFFGESGSIMGEGLQILKNAYKKIHSGGEIISFDGKNRFKEGGQTGFSESSAPETTDDLTDVLTTAQTTGLFSNDQLIVFQHAEKVLGSRAEKVIAQLKIYFKDPNPHSCMVFLATGLRKTSKIVEAVEHLGWAVQCSEMPDWKIGGWLRSQAFEKGLTLTEECAQRLVEKIGTDVACLHRALEQLTVFIFPKKNATTLDVRELPVPGIEPEIFAFLDSFGMRQIPESLLCLNRMGDKMDSGVLFLLYQRIRELLRIAVEKSKGVGQNLLAEKLRLHPFRVKQLWNQSQQYSVGELKSALLELVHFQAGIVSGRISSELSDVIMQKWILKWGQKQSTNSRKEH
jgi:DNA polymerase III subunit delta